MMLYSLKRAADDLKPEIEKYKIFVDPHARAVSLENGPVKILDPYTSYRACRQTIREYIKAARELEQKAIDDNQNKLF